MVDLSAKPFNLDQDRINWVENIMREMNEEEKIRQLFILLDAGPVKDEKTIKENFQNSGQGGLRWQNGSSEQVYEQNSAYQKYSAIPLLIAANCDDGGIGAFPEGSFVATAAQAAAAEGDETAYRMGLVAARESGSVGCNWLFNPVSDIYMNWRNTIVNTRCFGDNADTVLKNTRAFIRGVKDGSPHMACCAKHFPGDGVEELDHHLVMGVNSLGVREWDNSFGKVYRGLIEDGIESIMVGFFAFPAMSRKFNPSLSDDEIFPGPLSRELIGGLLREELGFNGVILTDATHMIGLSGVARREDALPKMIANGCDMILFANDFDEDLESVREGLRSGMISAQRLDDAVRRVLGLKAKVRAESPMPEKSWMEKWIGCEEHRKYAAEAADRCVTLVKDTGSYLPINPDRQKKALLVYAHTTPNSKSFIGDPVKKIVAEELEQAGFDVEIQPSFYDLELENGPSAMNFVKMLSTGTRKEFREKYDVVFLVINVKGYAQENNVRLRWSISHSKELPWYIPEVPTVGISLNYTNHLIDIPQIKCFINAYSSERASIKAAVDKICGRSPFRGKAGETVFCDRWEAKL